MAENERDPDSGMGEGGDPACWAGLLCEECGCVLTDGVHREGCTQSSRAD
ncbi:MAG TPA: hypothetical protein VGG21_00825 [Acidimicrobiales bacterium]|jgi:hypothetical protein